MLIPLGWVREAKVGENMQKKSPNSVRTEVMKDAGSEDEVCASELIAREILESIQESGERDKVKEWLFDDLESKGWTRKLFDKAAQIYESDGKEKRQSKGGANASKESAGNENGEDMSTLQVASLLSESGLGALGNISLCGV